MRDRITGIEIRIDCKPKTGTSTTYDTLAGTLEPEVASGRLEYGTGAGELTQSAGGAAAVTGKETLKAPRKATITASAP